MYVQWAKRRRMHLRRLDTGNSTGALLAVGGFGSYGILEREAGLHVFEVPRDKHRFDRIRVRVAVAPAPTLAGLAGKAAAKAAHQALGTAELSNIVRRYRAEPSPLVRDDVSGWRTGRLETVLGGDFDLL